MKPRSEDAFTVCGLMHCYQRFNPRKRLSLLGGTYDSHDAAFVRWIHHSRFKSLPCFPSREISTAHVAGQSVWRFCLPTCLKAKPPSGWHRLVHGCRCGCILIHAHVDQPTGLAARSLRPSMRLAAFHLLLKRKSAHTTAGDFLLFKRRVVPSNFSGRKHLLDGHVQPTIPSNIRQTQSWTRMSKTNICL